MNITHYKFLYRELPEKRSSLSPSLEVNEWEEKEEITLSQFQVQLKEENRSEPVEIDIDKTDTGRNEKELSLTQTHSQLGEEGVVEGEQELPIKLSLRGTKPQLPSWESGRVDLRSSE